MKKLHNLFCLKERRRNLRRNNTFQEKVVWEILRNKKLGFKFRRQHSIGYYIADFYCAEKRLIIEIDGDSHDYEYDAERDMILNNFGYIVLRFKNEEIDRSLNKVVETIKRFLIASP